MSRLAFAASLFLLAAGAAAEPVKCVDASGKIRYLDESMAGEAKCKPVRDAMNIVAPQDPPEARPETTEGRRRPPRASPRGAETDTRLADAEGRLADAKSKLAEQEAFREGGERNYARVQERLQPFRDAVERAQQEVEQMRRESR
jgi:hypothetical protein